MLVHAENLCHPLLGPDALVVSNFSPLQERCQELLQVMVISHGNAYCGVGGLESGDTWKNSWRHCPMWVSDVTYLFLMHTCGALLGPTLLGVLTKLHEAWVPRALHLGHFSSMKIPTL